MKLMQAVCLAASVVAANGCVPVPVPTEVKVEHTGERARMRSHEAIAILVPAGSASQTFEAAEGCLRQALHASHPYLRIISSEEFKRSVFSYAIPEGMARAKYFGLMYNQPAIQERIRALHLRYIFFLESGLDTENTRTKETALGAGLSGIIMTYQTKSNGRLCKSGCTSLASRIR